MPPKTAMIVVTKPNKVLKIIPEVKRYLKNTLYILLLSENKMQNLNVDNNVLLNKKQQHNLGSASKYSSSVVGLYKDTFYTNLEVRVLLSGLREPFSTDIQTKIPIEVIYIDNLLNKIDFKKLLTSQITNKMSDCEVISVNNEDKCSASNSTTNSVGPQSEIVYNNVVLGGTFDRLHVGHKILLSEAVLHCQKKLTVGVTDTDMLKTKTLWELIEPCSVRMQNVKDFLQEVEPRLEYDVIPINDIYGPTKDDPDFEMIVVSAETIKGGDKINQVRKENGLSQMAVYSVPLLPELNKADVIEEDKVSSSNNRLRLLGTLLKPPTPKPHLPKVPYLIGLSGGITSGKSGISKYLEELGASVINADLLGHRVYEVGTTCYKLVVDHFGQKVVSDNGEINRKVLGEIVFSDKEQLQKLNSLVWPAILELLRKEIAKLRESGSKVVVTEAAVLLQANWKNEFHEIWTAIVPPEEAIKRLKERNLTEEEAKKRLSSQPSNTEQLEISDVVFCTLWNPRYTQKQVVRAWDELQSRLGFNNTEQSSDTLINKG